MRKSSRSIPSPFDRLRHIRQETEFLLESTNEVTEDEFLTDGALTRACSRSLEIIGEATRNLPDGFRPHSPQVEWQIIAFLGDELIHGYATVDLVTVWRVVTENIPELAEQVAEILEAEESDTE